MMDQLKTLSSNNKLCIFELLSQLRCLLANLLIEANLSTANESKCQVAHEKLNLLLNNDTSSGVSYAPDTHFAFLRNTLTRSKSEDPLERLEDLTKIVAAIRTQVRCMNFKQSWEHEKMQLSEDSLLESHVLYQKAKQRAQALNMDLHEALRQQRSEKAQKQQLSLAHQQLMRDFDRLKCEYRQLQDQFFAYSSSKLGQQPRNSLKRHISAQESTDDSFDATEASSLSKCSSTCSLALSHQQTNQAHRFPIDLQKQLKQLQSLQKISERRSNKENNFKGNREKRRLKTCQQDKQVVA